MTQIFFSTSFHSMIMAGTINMIQVQRSVEHELPASHMTEGQDVAPARRTLSSSGITNSFLSGLSTMVIT